jgi:anti-sigma28 factor (negative regulator of flagellin synthesis)
MEMVIDKIGGTNPVYGSKKTEAAVRADNPARAADNVQISAEAARAADTSRVARMAKESSDTERSEKIKDIKEKLDKGEYNSLPDELLSAMADKIVSEFTERT